MSGFVFLRGVDAAGRAERLRARLGEVGVVFNICLPLPEGVLLFRSNPQLAGRDLFIRDSETFAAFSGTFFWQGGFGGNVLGEFLETFAPERRSLDGAQGQFCLIVRKSRTLYLFVDPLGMNKLYCDEAQTTFSSLFLGVAEGLEKPTIDAQGCYEYAWNGAVMGTRTFYTQVRTVRVGHCVTLGQDVAVDSVSVPFLRDEDAGRLSADELVARHVERGRALFRTYARHFAERVNLSMSGGYDSRLMLALFLDGGVRPDIFSYGRAGTDTDVAFAKGIAEGEGLTFQCIDKSAIPRLAPDAYAEALMRTYGQFDGWKVDGIFDNGADGPDRAARVASGHAKANGSAGEIYRNFFYLRGRPLWSRELVWAFYARYDPRACTELFSPADYEDELSSLIQHEVGASGALLQRSLVELAYPLVRVRYWTARDVQLNQSFGLCLFPFLEPCLIRGTCDIPIGLKSYGVFESRMIRRLSLRLASYPSDYGFDMSADPPRSYVAKAQLTYMRPPAARRYSYRLRHRRRHAPRPYFLEAPYLRESIDPEFPIMSRYFRIAAISDVDVFNRVATMEYNAERHCAREGVV